MTVPAVAPPRTGHAVTPTLPIGSTPLADPSPALRAALAADITPAAYRLYAATILALPAGEWLSTARMAEAAQLRHHQARPLIGQLVRRGLLQARRVVIRIDGEPRDVKLYLPAVTR